MSLVVLLLHFAPYLLVIIALICVAVSLKG